MVLRRGRDLGGDGKERPQVPHDELELLWPSQLVDDDPTLLPQDVLHRLIHDERRPGTVKVVVVRFAVLLLAVLAHAAARLGVLRGTLLSVVGLLEESTQQVTLLANYSARERVSMPSLGPANGAAGTGAAHVGGVEEVLDGRPKVAVAD